MEKQKADGKKETGNVRFVSFFFPHPCGVKGFRFFKFSRSFSEIHFCEWFQEKIFQDESEIS